MPYSLGIELTNNCNLGCPFCATGSGLSSRKKGYMPIELFQKICRELSPYIVKTMFYFQGESMMHPGFFEMLEGARDMGAVISTNGHFLDSESCKKLSEARLDKIIVSIDGISESTYLKYRKKGNLDKVLSGIEELSYELRKRGRGKKLELQVLVNKYNEGELELLHKYSKSIGARIRYKSMQLDTGTHDINYLPRDKRFRRYDIEEGELSIRSRKPNNCYRLWTNPVITWDGKVLPCCFDKDAEYIMGDISSQSFADIWRGSKYVAFRREILSNRSGIDICNNCSEGLNRQVKT
jgi:radical SAM protein with 4Fe4S-binding SPASM domain